MHRVHLSDADAAALRRALVLLDQYTDDHDERFDEWHIMRTLMFDVLDLQDAEWDAAKDALYRDHPPDNVEFWDAFDADGDARLGADLIEIGDRWDERCPGDCPTWEERAIRTLRVIGYMLTDGEEPAAIRRKAA